MKFLDNEHKILKYICKLKLGVTKAHVKCLKQEGNDIKNFNVDKEEARKVVDKIFYTDAKIDEYLLKAMFVARGVMTASEFAIGLKTLIYLDYIDNNFNETELGKKKNNEFFKVYYNEDFFQEMLKKDGLTLSTANLLFND